MNYAQMIGGFTRHNNFTYHGNHYMVDTSITFDAGLECMVFNTDASGDHVDWGNPVFTCSHIPNEYEAAVLHDDVLNNPDKYVG